MIRQQQGSGGLGGKSEGRSEVKEKISEKRTSLLRSFAVKQIDDEF